MRAPRSALLSVLSLSLVVGACAGGGSKSATDPPAVGSDGATAASPTAQSTAERGPLTIAFAGDVHFTGRTEQYLTEPGAGRLVQALRPLAAADLSIVNLETAITDRGTKEPKTFTFRAPAGALDVLDRAGVDVASMANNHGVDYGPDGLADSLAAVADSPVEVVGIGQNEDAAMAPAVVEVKGRKVAVIGATQVGDRTQQVWSAGPGKAGVASAAREERLVQAVRDARSAADIVIVYLHWGVERAGCPSAAQKSIARKLSEAGADVVTGTHAHQLQGAGWLNGGTSYVDYGLGNFVWWRSVGEPGVVTGVLTLTMDGRRTRTAAWTPMRIADDGLPVEQTGEAAAKGLATWNKVRGCSGLADAPEGSGGTPSGSATANSPTGATSTPGTSTGTSTSTGAGTANSPATG